MSSTPSSGADHDPQLPEQDDPEVAAALQKMETMKTEYLREQAEVLQLREKLKEITDVKAVKLHKIDSEMKGLEEQLKKLHNDEEVVMDEVKELEGKLDLWRLRRKELEQAYGKLETRLKAKADRDAEREAQKEKTRIQKEAQKAESKRLADERKAAAAEKKPAPAKRKAPKKTTAQAGGAAGDGETTPDVDLEMEKKAEEQIGVIAGAIEKVVGEKVVERFNYSIKAQAKGSVVHRVKMWQALQDDLVLQLNRRKIHSNASALDAAKGLHLVTDEGELNLRNIGGMIRRVVTAVQSGEYDAWQEERHRNFAHTDAEGGGSKKERSPEEQAAYDRIDRIYTAMENFLGKYIPMEINRAIKKMAPSDLVGRKKVWEAVQNDLFLQLKAAGVPETATPEQRLRALRFPSSAKGEMTGIYGLVRRVLGHMERGEARHMRAADFAEPTKKLTGKEAERAKREERDRQIQERRERESETRRLRIEQLELINQLCLTDLLATKGEEGFLRLFTSKDLDERGFLTLKETGERVRPRYYVFDHESAAKIDEIKKVAVDRLNEKYPGRPVTLEEIQHLFPNADEGVGRRRDRRSQTDAEPARPQANTEGGSRDKDEGEEHARDYLTRPELENLRKAKDIILETKMASISMIQRRLRIGYDQAARLMEVMEEEGFVSRAGAGGEPRTVLGTVNDEPELSEEDEEAEEDGELEVSEGDIEEESPEEQQDAAGGAEEHEEDHPEAAHASVGEPARPSGAAREPAPGHHTATGHDAAHGGGHDAAHPAGAHGHGEHGHETPATPPPERAAREGEVPLVEIISWIGEEKLLAAQIHILESIGTGSDEDARDFVMKLFDEVAEQHHAQILHHMEALGIESYDQFVEMWTRRMSKELYGALEYAVAGEIEAEKRKNPMIKEIEKSTSGAMGKIWGFVREWVPAAAVTSLTVAGAAAIGVGTGGLALGAGLGLGAIVRRIFKRGNIQNEEDRKADERKKLEVRRETELKAYVDAIKARLKTNAENNFGHRKTALYLQEVMMNRDHIEDPYLLSQVIDARVLRGEAEAWQNKAGETGSAKDSKEAMDRTMAMLNAELKIRSHEKQAQIPEDLQERLTNQGIFKAVLDSLKQGKLNQLWLNDPKLRKRVIGHALAGITGFTTGAAIGMTQGSLLLKSLVRFGLGATSGAMEGYHRDRYINPDKKAVQLDRLVKEMGRDTTMFNEVLQEYHKMQLGKEKTRGERIQSATYSGVVRGGVMAGIGYGVDTLRPVLTDFIRSYLDDSGTSVRIDKRGLPFPADLGETQTSTGTGAAGETTSSEMSVRPDIHWVGKGEGLSYAIRDDIALNRDHISAFVEHHTDSTDADAIEKIIAKHNGDLSAITDKELDRISGLMARAEFTALDANGNTIVGVREAGVMIDGKAVAGTGVYFDAERGTFVLTTEDALYDTSLPLHGETTGAGEAGGGSEAATERMPPHELTMHKVSLHDTGILFTDADGKQYVEYASEKGTKFNISTDDWTVYNEKGNAVGIFHEGKGGGTNFEVQLPGKDVGITQSVLETKGGHVSSTRSTETPASGGTTSPELPPARGKEPILMPGGSAVYGADGTRVEFAPGKNGLLRVEELTAAKANGSPRARLALFENAGKIPDEIRPMLASGSKNTVLRDIAIEDRVRLDLERRLATEPGNIALQEQVDALKRDVSNKIISLGKFKNSPPPEDYLDRDLLRRYGFVPPSEESHLLASHASLENVEATINETSTYTEDQKEELIKWAHYQDLRNTLYRDGDGIRDMLEDLKNRGMFREKDLKSPEIQRFIDGLVEKHKESMRILQEGVSEGESFRNITNEIAAHDPAGVSILQKGVDAEDFKEDMDMARLRQSELRRLFPQLVAISSELRNQG